MNAHRAVGFGLVLLAVTAVPLVAQGEAGERELPLGARPMAAASAVPSDAEHTETATPIKHFITLMQENHSFDNYFGTYPGADGHPVDACVPIDPEIVGPCVEPFPIENKAVVDLGHTDEVFDRQYREGAMDGFISAFTKRGDAGELPMGYYDDSDIPFYWNIADQFVLFDRFFTSARGGSVWNHFFWVTGSPGNERSDTLLDGGFDHVPTIFDRLQEAGVSWKFYVQNYDPSVTFRTPGAGDRASQIVWVPVLNYNRFLDDPELHDRIVPIEQYFDDLHAGTLPSVAFMVPSGASEHPPGSIQAGERFVRTLLTELMRSSAWDSTAFMWTYDDWGGWYDHVAPPQVDQFGYGFRAPALLVSPYAKRGFVDSTQLDFTSMLAFIEHNWDVAPLAARDAAANNFLTAFDFSAAAREPVFVSRERVVVPPEEANAAVIYLLYAWAIGLPLALAAFASLRRRGPDAAPGTSAAPP